jgi:hypothetical protein
LIINQIIKRKAVAFEFEVEHELSFEYSAIAARESNRRRGLCARRFVEVNGSTKSMKSMEVVNAVNGSMQARGPRSGVRAFRRSGVGLPE